MTVFIPRQVLSLMRSDSLWPDLQPALLFFSWCFRVELILALFLGRNHSSLDIYSSCIYCLVTFGFKSCVRTFIYVRFIFSYPNQFVVCKQWQQTAKISSYFVIISDIYMHKVYIFFVLFLKILFFTWIVKIVKIFIFTFLFSSPYFLPFKIIFNCNWP